MYFLLSQLAFASPISTPESPPTSEATVSPIARALNVRPQVETLANGLTVVLHEDRRSPMVNITTLVRVGSADDPASASGLSHLLEHLMFKGSPNAPESEWGRLLEESGAQSSGWTERDWTLYQTTGPSSSLDRLLFLESDRLGWLAESISEESLALEKDIIANERASRQGDSRALYSKMHAHLWPESHPYHRPVLGDEADLEGLELGRIAQLFESFYRPSNAIVVLSGDIDRTTALESLKANYGLIERRGSRALRAYPERPRRGTETRLQTTEAGGDAVLSLGWNTPPWGHPDLPAIRLAAEILKARAANIEGISFKNKPQTALRARRAGGELVLQMVSGGLELEELLEEFDAVFWSLANQGPSQEELDSARMQWQAQKIASLEGLESTGLMLARCMAVHENPDCMAPEMSAIEQVRPQQIQAAIRSHLSRDRVILARVPENQRHLGLDATTEAK